MFRSIVIIFIILCLIFLYFSFNPEEYGFFPKCPIYSLTGYQCPGCGSQRSIHYLLNFKIFSALQQNFLVPFFILYIFLLMISKWLDLKFQAFLENQYMLYIILIIIITYLVLRNMPN